MVSAQGDRQPERDARRRSERPGELHHESLDEPRAVADGQPGRVEVLVLDGEARVLVLEPVQGVQVRSSGLRDREGDLASEDRETDDRDLHPVMPTLSPSASSCHVCVPPRLGTCTSATSETDLPSPATSTSSTPSG